MPVGASTADAYMRLRVDDSEVSKDIERGVGRADTRTAGRKSGRGFVQGFREGTSDLPAVTRSFGTLAAGMLGLSDAAAVASGNSSMLARVVGAVGVATGLAEPAVSALVVAVGALGAATAAAGVGLGAYGAALVPIMGRVTELNKLQEQAAKGSKTAQAQLAKLLKTTPPAIAQFAKAVRGAKKDWTDWAFALSRPVLAPLTHSLSLINPLLKDMTPFVRAAASALDVLVGKLSAAVHSTGFKDWLATMLPLVKPVIVGLGTAVGNIVAGLGSILKAFAPFSRGVVRGIVHITQAFQDWAKDLGKHEGFRALVDMWKENWPLMREGLLHLLHILVNILKALAGMATPANSKALWIALNPILAVTEKLSTHPQLIELITYMLLLSKAGKTLGGIFGSIKSGWGGVTKFLGLVTGGKVQLGMEGAGDVMLVASKNMQKAADTMLAASGVAGKAGKAGTAAEGAGLAGGLGLLGTGGAIAGGALIAGGIVLELRRDLKKGIKAIVPDIGKWFSGTGGMLGVAASGWANLLLDHFSKPIDKFAAPVRAKITHWFHGAGQWLVASGKGTIDGFMAGARNTWNAVLGPWLHGAGRRAIDRVGDLTRTLWNTGTKLVGGLIGGARAWWREHVAPWLAGAGGRALRLVGELGGILVNPGRALIGGLWAGIRFTWRNMGRWLGGARSWFAGAFAGAGSWLWNAGSSIIGGLLSGMVSKFETVKSWVGGVGGWIKSHKGPREIDLRLLVPAGHNIMGGLLRGLQEGFGGGAAPFLHKLATTISDVFRSLSAGAVFKAQAGGFGVQARMAPSVPAVGLGAGAGRRHPFAVAPAAAGPEETNRLLASLIRAVREAAPATGAAMAEALNATTRAAAYRAAYSVR